MEYRQLGRTGVRVSKVCLGTMNFGSATDEETSIRIVHEALDAGINFVDTADAYTHGASEEIVGKALAQDGRRDQVVLASKAVAHMGKGPNDWGASRYHLVRACEDSLRRLRTDRIDLFYLHIVDLTTPMDEVFETLDVLVRQGKILYVGTSKWSVPLIMEALALSERCGLPRIVAEQPPYNLLDRGIENELIWVAMRYGIAIVTWGPLGGGILSGKYEKGQTPPKGSRYEKAGPDNRRLTPAALDVVEKLRVIADAKGITLPELCHARLLHRQGVVTPIVGPRTVEHLRSALKACEITLSPEEVAQIDQIVPPGTAVSDFYEGHIYGRMRRAALAGDPMAY